MSKVKRAGSDASFMSRASLGSLISVSLNEQYESVQDHALQVPDSQQELQRVNSNPMSLENPDWAVASQQSEDGERAMVCHDLGEIFFHTVPTSVKKGTHKLLLNHPKFDVEFRGNHKCSGPARTVRIWAKIGPKGSGRSNMMGQGNLHCNHRLGDSAVHLAPPNRIPHNEGVQPVDIKGKMSDTVVPSEAILAQAQCEIPGSEHTSRVHLQGDFNTNVQGERHQLILPRGGAAKNHSHLFTFSVQVQVNNEPTLHVFSKDFDVIFAADRKLRKSPGIAAELGISQPSPHKKAKYTDNAAAEHCDVGSLTDFAKTAAAEQQLRQSGFAHPTPAVQCAGLPVSKEAVAIIPAEMIGSGQAGTMLIKSRVVFREQGSLDFAMKLWDKVFSPEGQPSPPGMLWHWEKVDAKTIEVIHNTSAASWRQAWISSRQPVSYTHLRAHETPEHLVCRLLLEKKKKNS
eukprot:TRINITY_DN1887_c0_g1_i1.p1 TRINITY_DN1887_c0_g1~~TRINITY_DN1887_c0_g1_i1.p1  ORF type:complete len:459 (+),score=96.24 TRINITY_DN1887_c0_g1_i1:179-1555(+)